MPKLTFREDYCKGCALCVNACPLSLLRMSEERMNDKGHYIAEIAKPEDCVACQNCALMCPDCCITIVK